MELLPLHTEGSTDWVIETYKSTVYGIALTRTKNRNDADDIFQDVFLTYIRKQPRFNDEEHRKAWLIKVTINCTKKYFNKKQRNTTESTKELSDKLFSLQFEDETIIYTALCELSEKYRIVLYLHYFEELSVNEISKILNLRSGTVRVQMMRGRELMREKLKKELKGEFL